MDSDFWGLLLAPNKKYCNEANKPIRVTTACFGEKVVKGSRSCVHLKIKDREFVFCVLTESTNESQSLDVYLPTDAEFSFRVTGPNEVHLTGHIVEAPEEAEDSDDELYQKYLNGELDSDELSDGSDSDDFSDESDSNEYLEQANIEEIEESKKVKPSVKMEKKSLAVVESSQNQKAPKEGNQVPAVSKEAPTSNDMHLTKKQRKALAKQQREQASQSEDKKDAQKRKAEETPSENKKAKTEGAQTQQNQEGGNKSTPQKGAKTHSNGLIVEDITVGTGKEAKNNDTIQMRYVGKLSTGKVFDKNTSGEPFTFHLGKGEVIKGWDQGILGMKVGGERRLTIPAHLAYGKRGSPPAIPPKATLLFEVKLLNIK